MATNEYIYNYIHGLTNFEDFTKEDLINLYVTKTLIKTQRIFEYKNLPETIAQKDLELLLQVNGSCAIKEVEGKLYAFRCGLGGKPNPYYLPTIAVIANPGLNYNATLKIDEECVVMLNDSLYKGLMPLINSNAYLLAQCDIALKYATINSRMPVLISAPDDKTKAEAEKYLKDIEEGRKLGAIANKNFFEKLETIDYAKGSDIKSLIELKQYILGTFYQELGIQSQFNMKREAINEAEAALSEDILYPLIDDMLVQRQIGLEKVNKMYGTNINVELSSVWKQLREQSDLQMDLLNSEIDKNLGEEVKEDESNK